MALPKAIADKLGRQLKPQPALSREVIPPLENGDHLTRAEFERRYNAMPPHIRAELIEGVVHMSSPVRHKKHGKPHIQVDGWIATYFSETPGTDCSDNATVRLDLDNEPQPDVVLFLETAYGGQMQLSEDGYLEGAPELAVEVASSSVSIDLHAKLHAYRRNGVLEYIVWRVDDKEIDWFRLQGGQYERIAPEASGIIRSRVFPGLWLDPKAMLKGEMKKALATLRQGIASKEHAAFVRKLKQRAKAKR
jgi:Uma2 family endonuclease